MGLSMNDAFFDVPLIVETSRPGEFRRLASVSQAAVFMMERWPEQHGPRYRAALRACTGRLTSKDDVENARRAFLAAAKEAGLVVKDEDEDAELQPHPDFETTPPSRSEQKRRERARMEEEEEFLVRFLARETGIAEEQARELFHMIGHDRAALLREARILKARH
ncbi:DUF982 domain-containing protein (plasmid) [Mesorhizobium sp. AR02]|nr:DUF982 domain-containing protein [Mesorhizobium sp. AR02]